MGKKHLFQIKLVCQSLTVKNCCLRVEYFSLSVRETFLLFAMKQSKFSQDTFGGENLRNMLPFFVKNWICTRFSAWHTSRTCNSYWKQQNLIWTSRPVTDRHQYVFLLPACLPCKLVNWTNLSVVQALLKGSKVYDTHCSALLEESSSDVFPHTENKTKLNRKEKGILCFYIICFFGLMLKTSEHILNDSLW